ncbi:MAG: hypothetical protein K0U47_12205 [Epsilonproteobacteria bacterium]|nr:hypothetical protein [Campylobacterota bacterium]
MKYLIGLLCCISLLQSADLKYGVDALEKGDFATAFETFRIAAESGEKLAQYNLSVLYNHGYGVAKNHEKASYWLKQATSNNQL